MKKISLYLAIAVLPALLSLDNPPLVKTKVTDAITVLLPKNFHRMDDTDLVGRYPSVRQPIAAYTNDDHSVDFSINISASQWPDLNLDLASEFFQASIENMFDNVNMLDHGIDTIYGRKFIYFEFEYKIAGNSKVRGQEEPILNYTYIEYLVTRESALVVSFHCPRHLRPEWQETARKIMKSIHIKT
jgi:hypothetical protein